MNEHPNNPFESIPTQADTAGNPFAVTVSEQQSTVPASVINLGSQPVEANPFDNPAIPMVPVSTPNAEVLSAPVTQPVAPPIPIAAPAATESVETPAVSAPATKVASELESVPTDEEPPNPLQEVLSVSVFEKPPVFEHGAVKEPIENLEQTFEDLRIAKMDDFPELEDGLRVEWKVIYGTISKQITAPKKTVIGEFKRLIEESKEFKDALKKAKDKSPTCVIKAYVRAQSKGDTLPAYKGIFASYEDAMDSGKVISFVPASDGKVYEIRNEESGTYITPSGVCHDLSEVRAGFNPALPLIPNTIVRQVISFFKSLITEEYQYEAIANIYWDRENHEFHVEIPKQYVTAVIAESELNETLDPDRFLHYMDIHSHNVMPARFSARDDKDEKATRLYAVFGKLHLYIPELSVRISNGGKYLLIDPSTVFEDFGGFHPVEWNDQVSFGSGELPRRSLSVSSKGITRLYRDLIIKGGYCA